MIEALYGIHDGDESVKGRKKERKKRKNERWNETPTFYFLLLSVDEPFELISSLLFFSFKNDCLKIVRFDPRPVAFLMANALMARKEARVSFMENTISDKASINSLTPRHN